MLPSWWMFIRIITWLLYVSIAFIAVLAAVREIQRRKISTSNCHHDWHYSYLRNLDGTLCRFKCCLLCEESIVISGAPEGLNG